MIVCHCNVISEAELEGAINALLDDDPWQLIVPAKVFHALAKRGKCCQCFPNVVDVIVRVTEARRTGSGKPREGADERLTRLAEVRQECLSRSRSRR